jgi:polysaccharide pyruvyl transferase WcaK-like protein
MRLIFLGWYNRRNVGDESFKIVHHFLFPEVDKIWIENARGFEFHESDVVVVGAGDVVKPYYIKTLPSDVRFFIYGCGLTDADDLHYTVSLRERLYGAWFRNRTDVEELAKRGISARYTPDIFLQLSEQIFFSQPMSSARKRIAFLPSNFASREYQRCGNIKGASYMNYFVHECAAILDELSLYYDIDLIAMSGDNNDDDMAFLNSVFSLSHRRSCMRIHEFNPDPIRTLEVVSGASLCISMKFHGLIFSLISGRPFIDIGLTRKNAVFCTENGFDKVSVPHHSLHQGRFANFIKFAESEPMMDLVVKQRNDLSELAREEGRRFREAILNLASASI